MSFGQTSLKVTILSFFLNSFGRVHTIPGEKAATLAFQLIVCLVLYLDQEGELISFIEGHSWLYIFHYILVSQILNFITANDYKTQFNKNNIQMAPNFDRKEKMWMYVNRLTGVILLQETFPHCFCTKDNPRYLIQRQDKGSRVQPSQW